MRTVLHRLTIFTALLLLCGCERRAPHVDSKDGEESKEPVYDPDIWEIGEEVTCSDPVMGFDRLREAASERGVTVSYDPSLGLKHCPGVDGGVVATDLDDDGDIDLLFHNEAGFPHLYVNDGTGQFSPLDPGAGLDLPSGRRVTAAGAYDLDGDRLPEVFIVGDGFAAVSLNQGDLSFGDAEVIYVEEDYPYSCFNTVALGDIDGDEDLDLFLPALDIVPDEDFYAEVQDPVVGSIDRVFIQEDGSFSSPIELKAWDMTNMAMFAIFTDRDLDGDLDVLVGTDRPNSLIPPMAFWRNDGLDSDGLPRLTNDADEVSADLNISAMGVGSADLNGDGLMDYCLTDLYIRIRCLMSDGLGGYYDGGAALGLTPDIAAHPDWEDGLHEPSQWTTWSVELQDLDNDGYRDLAVVAGPPADGNPIHDPTFTFVQPDVLFRGTADGTFIEDNGTSGFHDSAAHYGMAAADLDRDGSLDLVVGPWEGDVLLWENPCTQGAWLTIEPIGPPGNAEGFGVRVAIERGEITDLQELHGLRTLGQAPSELYFGLGDVDTIDRIEVTWPDGIVQTFENAPTRRILYVRHPDALDVPLPSSL